MPEQSPQTRDPAWRSGPYQSLTNLRRVRRKLDADLAHWSSVGTRGNTPDEIRRSFFRGAAMLAELIALHHEIEEREEAINGAELQPSEEPRP